MLSICIPVYNYDCYELISKLFILSQKVGITVEIIVIDDGSALPFRFKNSINENIVSVIHLNKNIGRARVRNLFCTYARFENMLFLDCDIQIIDPKYLGNYVDEIDSGFEVITGGTNYPQENPGKKRSLHWKYCRFKEEEFREKLPKDPYQSFMTNNFLIKKEIFEKICFDETLNSYGHEDTLFGYQLKKYHYKIRHIDNPVLHTHLDVNEIFAIKSAQAVENLVRLTRNPQYGMDFAKNVTLSKMFFQLQSQGLDGMLKAFAWFLLPLLRKRLCQGNANLKEFSIYKLLLFTKVYNSYKE